ncbi:MAG: hypothetical protein IJS60_03065 [Abditibacteriota bacterium]|nr:hypothetical protein [Abditibacteriota bacterium]
MRRRKIMDKEPVCINCEIVSFDGRHGYLVVVCPKCGRVMSAKHPFTYLGHGGPTVNCSHCHEHIHAYIEWR